MPQCCEGRGGASGAAGGRSLCSPLLQVGSYAAIPEIQLFAVTPLSPWKLAALPSPRLLPEMESPQNSSLVLGLPVLAQPGVGAKPPWARAGYQGEAGQGQLALAQSRQRVRGQDGGWGKVQAGYRQVNG